jgi:hypothetical protein
MNAATITAEQNITTDAPCRTDGTLSFIIDSGATCHTYMGDVGFIPDSDDTRTKII